MRRPPPSPQDAIPTLTNGTKFNDLPAVLQDLLNDIESVAGPRRPSIFPPSIAPCISHTHVCRNLVQSGTNIAKDLKTREFGQEIVNNATTGRQIFHVRTDHVLRRILPIRSASPRQRTHYSLWNR